MFCFYVGDTYFSLSIFYLFVSKLFFGEVFYVLVILTAILFPVKTPLIPLFLWMTLFEKVLNASIADCLAW